VTCNGGCCDDFMCKPMCQPGHSCMNGYCM
jgi:hypothetical protein